jgi:hypothetical protein
MKTRMRNRAMLLVAAMVIITAASLRLQADTGTCGGVSTTVPFTDVMSSPFFCQIAEAYFSALTNGTDATHYSPSANVPREQMAAFVTRTQDSALRRSSRRAALGQWWTEKLPLSYPVGNVPQGVQSDGADLWVANNGNGTVTRIRASDGALLGTWTGATGASSVLVAGGQIFITGYTTNRLYEIHPLSAPGPVLTFGGILGLHPSGLTYDGQNIWTANNSGSVSLVVGGGVTTIVTGFTSPGGILFDGTNVWVADFGDNKLKKLDSSGNILSSVTVGSSPFFPVFDGTNIWVPNDGDDSVSVVRVRDSGGNPLANPFLLATLTGNGLSAPVQAAFDGQRILVTNNLGSVSLWKAADLTPLGSVSTGLGHWGACSDGINFWVVAQGSPGSLFRF